MSASFVLEKENREELLGVNQVVGGPPSNFSVERTELFGTSLQSTAFPKKSWALGNALVICIFFGKESYFL